MLDPQTIGYDQARATTFYHELEDRVRAMPGVQSVSLAYAVPLGFPGKGAPVYAEGQPVPPNQQAPWISYNSVDTGYFETMRVPLLRGRAFTESDKETARPVAIVNEKMKKLWPNADPVGKRFSVKSVSGPFIEVVGLARDGTSVPPEALIAGVQEQIHNLAPDLPVMDIHPMQQIVMDWLVCLSFD